MTQTLVILAAGMGSRFGGPKQLEPLGSNGETIVDFSIYDALRSGFGAIALVVRRAMLDAFERSVCARWLPHVRVELCFQEMNDLPPPFTAPAGRSRPWGTAHALLRAENTIDGPFGVINADDFYGISAFRTLSSFLQEAVSSGATLSTDHVSLIMDHGSRITDHAVVSFPLRHTLGDGPVNRALLRVSPDGWLEEIEEITVELDGDDGCYHTSDRSARTIPGDAPFP